MIFSHTNVEVGIVHCTSLAYDNVAGLYDLATEFLESETLAMGLTTVL